MKPLLKALIATVVTVGLLLAYAAVMYLRVQQYIAHGWEMPLSFRVQVGLSAFIFRFWWVVAIFFAPMWSLIFFLTHSCEPDKTTAANAP